MGAGAMGPGVGPAVGRPPPAGAGAAGGRKGALKGAAGAAGRGAGAGERAGPSGGGAAAGASAGAAACGAAGPERAKSVRWNLPEGNPGGSGDGRRALMARARLRAMKRALGAGKAHKNLPLPPEARIAAPEHGTEAGPGESSVLNKIFSAPGSACLEVKGKNSLGYIVNKAFMSKNRKMERQIEKLLRENAQLKRS